MTDAWTAEMQSLYSRVRAKQGLCYGIWRVTGPCPPFNNYEVKDLKGNTVIGNVPSKELAELIAALPDLCDPCLRPSCAPGSIVANNNRVQPIIGTADVQSIHDKAYSHGFNAGEKKGWEDASDGESGAS